MRPNNSLRQMLGLTQLEKAIWLGVSRSEVNMTERGERSLPTPAYLRLCRLETAMDQLPAAIKEAGAPAIVNVEACCALMQHHLEVSNTKLYKLKLKMTMLEARYTRLKTRQQTLELLRNCNGADCTEPAKEWLAYAIFLNEQKLSLMHGGQLFMMKHTLNMLLAEVAATEQMINEMRAGNRGDIR